MESVDIARSLSVETKKAANPSIPGAFARLALSAA